MTATQQYARSLARDPLGMLIAIWTRHRDNPRALQHTSRAYLAEGCYTAERGESLYYARRSMLLAIKTRAGAGHADYAAAIDLVRQMEAAEGDALGVAA